MRANSLNTSDILGDFTVSISHPFLSFSPLFHLFWATLESCIDLLSSMFSFLFKRSGHIVVLQLSFLLQLENTSVIFLWLLLILLACCPLEVQCHTCICPQLTMHFIYVSVFPLASCFLIKCHLFELPNQFFWLFIIVLNPSSVYLFHLHANFHA